MPRYRKKPIVVEAMQLVADTRIPDGPSLLDPHTRAHAEIAGWMLANDFAGFRVTGNTAPFGLLILTNEGWMEADPGDWIIKEPFPTADRKFYPCKPSIFEATYEPDADEPRVLDNLEIREINIGSGPNAWGETIHVVEDEGD